MTTPSIVITVKLFADLREQLGFSETQISLSSDKEDSVTVMRVWENISKGRRLPSNALCARNHEYCKRDQELNSNDEIAFFPPVTGG